MGKLKGVSILLGWMLLASPALASYVCATDDLGEEICLEHPAKRIAALSPGATELAWAAGAGDQVVAVVAYSDYPRQPERSLQWVAIPAWIWNGCWSCSRIS